MKGKALQTARAGEQRSQLTAAAGRGRAAVAGLAAFILAGVDGSNAAQPVSTAFTYQGRLTDGGNPANGSYDLQFKLFDALSGGLQIGSPVCKDNVMVTNGLLTVTLNENGEFGPTAFAGDARWLQISVRPGSTATCADLVTGFVLLSPREPLTAAPYALGVRLPMSETIATTGTSDPAVKIVDTGTAGAARFEINNASSSANALVASTSGPGAGLVVIGEPNGHVPGSLATGALYVRANDDPIHVLYLDQDDIDSWQSGFGSSIGTDLHIQRYSEGDIILGEGGGKVGINNASPAAKLHVVGSENDGTNAALKVTAGFATMLFDGDEIDSFLATLGVDLKLNSNSDGDVILATGGGNVGIGSATPQARLHIVGGTDSATGPPGTPGAGGGFLVTGNTGGLNISMDDNEIMARSNGAVAPLHLNHNGGEVRIGQGSAGTGKLLTPVLQITGGADLSENFDVQMPGNGAAEPGTVVCIDVDHPGQLVPCSRAYDRTVAGVISGAGGVKPGMLMGQGGTLADGAHPVSLTGRVYVRCDASEQAIAPGDLLTTSALSGYAMKVTDHAQAHGAVLGKAMTSLARGESGLVLVLVSLQ